MNENSELLAEAWDELEAALGGRFRNGAECPYVLELFRLAFADAKSEAADPDAEFLRGHLEVCPVCRHRYRAALVAASEHVDESAGDLAAAVSAAYPSQSRAEPGSMLDEFTPVPPPPDAMLREHGPTVPGEGGIPGTAAWPLMTAGGPLGPGSSAAAESAGVFAVRAAAPTPPHGANGWLIGFADDAAAVRRRIAVYAFADPEHRFEIRIFRLPVPGRTDLVQAQLEIEPVPTKNDLELVVEFRVGGKRQFRLEVPPELRRDPSAEPRPRTRTAPSEPLPAAAFDLQGGSEWRDAIWPAELILR